MKYMMKNYDRGCSKTSQFWSIKLLSELESKFNKLNLNCLKMIVYQRFKPKKLHFLIHYILSLIHI